MPDQRRYGVVTSDETCEYESKQRQQARAGSSTIVLPEEFSFFRLPKDKNFIKVDILPFLAETANGLMPLSRFNYYIHRNVGAGLVSVVCPLSQKGLPCPICEYLRGLNRSDEEDKEILRNLRVQQRQLYAMTILDGEPDTKDKVFILDTSEFGFGHILDEKIKNRDVSDPQEANWNRYADLLEGWTLKLNLGERSIGNGTVYTAVSSIDFKPRTQQYSEDWYEKVPDLSQCAVLLEYNAIMKKCRAQPVATSEEETAEAASETPVPHSDSSGTYDITSGYNPMVTPESPAPSPAYETAAAASYAGADVEDDDPF